MVVYSGRGWVGGGSSERDWIGITGPALHWRFSSGWGWRGGSGGGSSGGCGGGCGGGCVWLCLGIECEVMLFEEAGCLGCARRIWVEVNEVAGAMGGVRQGAVKGHDFDGEPQSIGGSFLQ